MKSLLKVYLSRLMVLVIPCCVIVAVATATPPSVAEHPANVWIKRTPLQETPVSPRLGYEGACIWDLSLIHI